jgi:chromosome segregation protein
MILYRRWQEAAQARATVQSALAEALTLAAAAERAAREARAAREGREDALPPLREEEAIAGAILQRLQVQRDTLTDRGNPRA